MQKLLTIVLLLLTLTNLVKADEVGIRYNNTITTNGLFDLSPDYQGKLLEVKYDLTPWSLSNELSKNVYFEGAIGGYFNHDFLNSNISPVIEFSPGLQIQSGPVVAKISQGIALMPGIGIHTFEYTTHISLGLVDQASGLSLGIERTHYSPGITGGTMDFTGLVIGLRL